MSNNSTVTASAASVDGGETAGYYAQGFLHATSVVKDLRLVADKCERVFGTRGAAMDVALKANIAAGTTRADYPLNYSWFVFIADLYLDVIQPDLYNPVGWVAPPVECHEGLVEMSLDVNGMNNLNSALQLQGIRTNDQLARPVGPGAAGDALVSVDPDNDPYGKIIWTLPEETGLAWEMIGSASLLPSGTGSVYPGVPSPMDPLGIEYCSHHTLLTWDIERAFRIPVDVFGARALYTGINHELQTNSTYLWIPSRSSSDAPLLLEIAVPLFKDSPIARHLLGTVPSTQGLPSEDRYHMITFKVRDLDKAIHHLKKAGIGFETIASSMVITDPNDFLGIRWGFSSTHIPGDPRNPTL
jgi:hypothetical protein